jgi:hypothetical protein
VDKRIGLWHGLGLSIDPRHPLYSILIFDFYMPAKDIYHDTVKNTLIKDGWTIIIKPGRVGSLSHLSESGFSE